MRASREDGQGGTPRPGVLRRLGRRRPLTDSERIAAVAADADVPVEEVLRDVADFRLALETDMIIAAAAVEADSPDLLAEVIDGERLELATFHDRLLTRLADAAADDEIALRRARRAPRSASGWGTRFVAAAAAAIAVAGVGRSVVTPSTTPASQTMVMQTADQRYADFSTAVRGDSAIAVQHAADKLHQTIETLIAHHAGDPEMAQRAAQLLQAEIALLQINDPVGASAVLAQAHSLAKRLKQAAPAGVRATVAPVLDAAMSPRPTTKPKATTSPSPKATKSPSPSPSPSRSSSASSSQDPDGAGGPLDTP